VIASINRAFQTLSKDQKMPFCDALAVTNLGRRQSAFSVVTNTGEGQTPGTGGVNHAPNQIRVVIGHLRCLQRGK
jgi:hypothetical protein